MKRKYSAEYKEKIIDLYKEGLNCKQIESLENINREVVRRWVKNSGNIRHRGPLSGIKNEDFFDNVDTEYKAYFLGWLMADASNSIYNGQHSLKIHISYKDKELIDGFLLHIDSSNSSKKKTYIDKESYYTSLTSVYMCKRLTELGMTSKKDRTAIPNIAYELIRHFIRGYFDGDGITSIGNNSSNRSGFIGNKPILSKILECIKEDLTIHKCSCIAEMYYFQGGLGFSKRLYEYMYKNCNIWLNRKRDRMDIICGNTEVTSNRNRLLEP